MNPIPAEKFYGWKVVAAAFAIAIFGWGFGFYGPPVFLKAVQDARDKNYANIIVDGFPRTKEQAAWLDGSRSCWRRLGGVAVM